MKTIKGQSEIQYLLGAIKVVDQELALAARRNDLARMIDVSERLDSLKDCLVRVLRTDDEQRESAKDCLVRALREGGAL